MIHLNFRVPFAIIDHGMCRNAIVMYGKEKIMWRQVDRVQNHTFTHAVVMEVQYAHELVIDLLFIVLRFKWRGKFKVED